jgi:predicted alpha/beta-fold hydrolase
VCVCVCIIHSTRKDMVRRRREEGSTVVVLIARGMMDTRLVTWNTFHGARTGDVDAAATSLLDGLTSLASANGRGERRQVLAGVGYSMGERVFPLYRMLCFVFLITRVS